MPSAPPKYERPQGVRVVKANGEVIPVELSWRGVDEHGCGQWMICTPVDHCHGDRIEVAVYPPHCAVIWTVPHAPGGEP